MKTRQEVIEILARVIRKHGLETSDLLVIVDCCVKEMRTRNTIDRPTNELFLEAIRSAQGKEL